MGCWSVFDRPFNLEVYQVVFHPTHVVGLKVAFTFYDVVVVSHYSAALMVTTMVVGGLVGSLDFSMYTEPSASSAGDCATYRCLFFVLRDRFSVTCILSIILSPLLRWQHCQ